MPEGDTIFRTAEVLRRTLLGGVIRRAGSQPALGPDLLASGFDAAQADEAVRRLQADPDRPLGEALLDQRVMAGIGNVYKSEIAFLEGLDPWAPVRAVDDDASLHLVSTARRLLSANVGGGWRVTTGTPAPGRSLWVYGRAWRPCRRCATAIRGRRQGEQARMTYWCPRCQAGDPATPWPVCVPPPIFTVRQVWAKAAVSRGGHTRSNAGPGVRTARAGAATTTRMAPDRLCAAGRRTSVDVG